MYRGELELLAAKLHLAYVTIRGATFHYPRTIRGLSAGHPKNYPRSTIALFLQGKCTLSVGQLQDRHFEIPTGNAT